MKLPGELKLDVDSKGRLLVYDGERLLWRQRMPALPPGSQEERMRVLTEHVLNRYQKEMVR